MRFFSKSRKLCLSSLIVLTLLFSGCWGNHNNQSSAESSSKADSSSQNVIQSKNSPLMWEVTSKNSSAKLYLFGSIHATDDSAYPLNDYVTKAFNNSEYLAVEADIVAYEKNFSAQIATVKKLMYTDKTKINQHISADTYTKCKALLEQNGQYNSLYDVYKPAFWSSLLDNVLTTKSGLDAQKGIDTYLLNQAKSQNKKILEVESVDFQIDLLTNFPDNVQELILKSYTEDFDEQAKMLGDLYSYWKAGDQANLEKLLFSDETELTAEEKVLYEKYNNQLLTERNKGMLEKAKQYLKEGKNCFYVVGEAHMLGDDGLVKGLTDAGYTVKLIKN